MTIIDLFKAVKILKSLKNPTLATITKKVSSYLRSTVAAAIKVVDTLNWLLVTINTFLSKRKLFVCVKNILKNLPVSIFVFNVKKSTKIYV